MDKVLKSFIKRVDQRMKELKINQRELARRLGLPQPAVSLYLSGKRKPTSESIAKYADALECSPAFLVDTQDDISRIREPSRFEMAASLLNEYLPDGERRDAALFLLTCEEDALQSVIGGLRPFIEGARKAQDAATS